ncbi:MAG: TIGR04282 family arsenosugar biosynthesis glycosyltransferase [Acidimicrobiales bacterium]
MTHLECAVLIVAKTPTPGQAKTRLTPTLSPEEAADLAAASLLDTLMAVKRTAVANRIVALTGDFDRARRSREIIAALKHFTVIPQRGSSFSLRLIDAHAQAAALAGVPVLQIGMDTPQVTPELLSDAAETLMRPDVDTVLGPATDGGWWALGVSTPDMTLGLTDVVMSRPDTGAMTLSTLRRDNYNVCELGVLTDVDTIGDVRVVASEVAEGSQFRAAAGRYVARR